MSQAHFDLDLGDAGNAGVYRVDAASLDTMAALARDAGLRVLRVDLDACADKRTLLARLAAQLDFPSGFGTNWDALSDALRDLSWLPATTGYALLLESADALATASPGDFDTLLDILDEAASAWARQQVPLAVFIALDETTR